MDDHSGSADPQPTLALGRFAERFWETDALSTLSDYVSIRCLSPAFDTDWESHGEIARATTCFAQWAKRRAIPGATVEVIQQEGLTPVILVDVPATGGATRSETSGHVTLLYGHLDKQPPLGSWREGLDPFQAVREGDRLYGRGTADDGYAMFAALGAIEALAAADRPHGRCLVLVEASEESGSPHLEPYLAEVSSRVRPDLVVCLDSGCATYDRLWITSSLRGAVIMTVAVEVLTEGVHSGSAGGIVPSSFRLVRQLLSRVEDERTGKILVQACNVEVPARRRLEAERLAELLGEDATEAFPTVAGLELAGPTVADRILAGTWAPSLAYTGIDGIPSVRDGGNVLRPATVVKLSLRLPPSTDPGLAAEALRQALVEDPPSGARVTVEVADVAPGFEAPELAPWLDRSADEASMAFFDKPKGAMGEGGTIPFLATLQHGFPDAQFLVTGVLGEKSNAHGPNEMLHIPTVKRVTASIAHVLATVPG